MRRARIWGWAKTRRRASRRAIRDRCRHTDSVRITPSLRADMIFREGQGRLCRSRSICSRCSVSNLCSRSASGRSFHSTTECLSLERKFLATHGLRVAKFSSASPILDERSWYLRPSRSFLRTQYLAAVFHPAIRCDDNPLSRHVR